MAKLQRTDGQLRHRGARIWIGVVAVVIATAMWAGADDAFIVQLSSPLSAGANHRGDAIRATVVSPTAFQGDAIQGQVTESKTSKGKSDLQFTFTSLVHQGVSVPVAATVTSVANSQSQAGTDDAGRAVVASTQAPGDSQMKSRIGSGLGSLMGGRAGSAVSDASNLPSSPGAMAIRLETSGPDVTLAAGAKLGLSIRSTGEQSLDSLTPNSPAAGSAGAAPAAQGTTMAASSGGSAPAAGAGSTAGGQPELKSAKIEFIPGERTVFFDDFSDMVQDEPPPHWKVREGTVDLLVGDGVRELHAEEGVRLTSPTFSIPENFTFELEWTGQGETNWYFENKDGQTVAHVMVRGEPSGDDVNTSVEVKDENLGSGTLKADTSKPVHFALWAQQGRVRAYINGVRVVDTNQVVFGQMDHIEAQIGGYRPNGIRSVRVAESAPDFSTVINASGKYVTHGIYFDTDSNRLKVESGGVLKQVAAGLMKNPNLKLEVDGYTDSVGNDAHNLDLSKRRAQAVVSVLVSQFGIDAGRLTANGFGAAKPIGSNDTPEGRAQNRRVEFVKK
jgi:outer membrane protein OmpA-like peptidoglycan-associated protein